MRRVGIVALAALLVLTGLAGCGGAGSAYPNKTVEIVVPWTAGGVSDLTVRALAKAMEKEMGQPIMVSNKDGAAGITGAAYVAKAKPDGYVLGWIGGKNLAPELYQSENTYTSKDLIPIAQVSVGVPVLVVMTESGFTTMQQFMDWAKAQQTVKYAHSGRGNGPHMTGVLLADTYGLKMTDVPYGGDSESLTALLRKDVDVAFMNSASAITQYEAGKVKILALLNSKRVDALPNVPTFDEAKYPIDKGILVVNGVFAPKGTPEDVLKKVETAVEKATKDAAFQETMKKLSVVTTYSARGDFAKAVEDFKAKVGPIIKKTGQYK